MHSNLVESGLAAVVGFASADLENKYAHNALMQNAGLALQYGCFRLAAFAFSAAKSVFFSKDYAFLGLAVAIFPFLIQVVSLSRQRFQHVELLHMLVFFCRVSVVLMWSLEIFDPPAFASKTNVALSVYEMMATCACLQIRFRHNLWLRLFALIGNQRYFVFLGLTNAWRNSLLIQMPVAIGLYICDVRSRNHFLTTLSDHAAGRTPTMGRFRGNTLGLCDDDLGKLKQQSQSSALTSVSPATATSSCKQRSVTTSTSAVEHGSSRSTVLLPATTCARSQDTCATTKGMQQSRGSSSGNNLQAAPINPTDASRPPHPLPPREDNLGFLHKKYLQFRMDEYEISDVEYSATVMDVAHLGDLERVVRYASGRALEPFSTPLPDDFMREASITSQEARVSFAGCVSRNQALTWRGLLQAQATHADQACDGDDCIFSGALLESRCARGLTEIREPESAESLPLWRKRVD